MATYTPDPAANGVLAPNPATTQQIGNMQVASAPAMVNNSAIGGGVNFSMPSGPSVADTASQAYGFLTANNMIAQGFLGQTIASGQNFFNYQVSPLTQALASGISSLGTIGTAGATYMTNAAAQVPNYATQGSAYAQQFAQNIQYLEQSQSQQASNAIGAIQNVSQGSYNTSATASQQGGGGSFIVTALMETNPRDATVRLIHAELVAWRDSWVRADRARRRLLFVYFKVAPSIVASIRALDYEREVWAYLKHGYLVPASIAFNDGKLEEAWRLYVRMTVDAASIAGVDLSGYDLPEWARLEHE